MKKTVEGNFKMARFMGGLISGEGRLSLAKNEIWIPNHSVVSACTVESGKGPVMKYHKSWDWLMEVVEKIERIRVENADIDGEEMLEAQFYVKIEGSICSIAAQEVLGVEVLEDWLTSKERIKMAAVYDTCLQFIDWYNTVK